MKTAKTVMMITLAALLTAACEERDEQTAAGRREAMEAERPAPKPRCTADAAKAKFATEAGQLEEDRVQQLTRLRADVTRHMARTSSATRKLATAPAGLSAMPRANATYARGYDVPNWWETADREHNCERLRTRHQTFVDTLPLGSWSQLVFAQVDEAAKTTDVEDGTQVFYPNEAGLDLIISGWILGDMLSSADPEDKVSVAVAQMAYDAIVSTAASVFESETTTRPAISFGLQLMSGITALDPNYGEVFRTWVRRAWRASRIHDVEELVAQVQEEPGYLFSNSKKPEGWFARRWRNVGGSQLGVDMNALYRLGLLRAATQLEMADVETWASELKPQLTGATTLSGHKNDMHELKVIETKAPQIVARAMKLEATRRAMAGSGQVLEGE